MDPTSLLPLVLSPDPRGFNQGATEPSEPALDPCSLLSDRHYEVMPCVICALCCIFGVVYCCFVVLNQRQKQLQLLRIRQREAKKRQSQGSQEGSYRHKPSAVKRCAGDVLAPSYIQSLRDRQQLGTGTSLSNLNASAHTTVDLDYDSGSTVPLTTPRGCL
ncbi:hypothetical protein JD844_011212 [Phrynosoma platyrhinos]|uniref:Uncharacterized protein n=1 Tax=Phrynosoma platyrhinos TaxID=52577 RepID=A0ABQ7TJF6_PHRPL|nr:hypothetical protein JD844_011212 [Phrynosoma platyrhinos]